METALSKFNTQNSVETSVNTLLARYGRGGLGGGGGGGGVNFLRKQCPKARNFTKVDVNIKVMSVFPEY